MTKNKKIVFLVLLMILMVNDHYLKFVYPGMATGKLSDFAGLFIFPVFLIRIFHRSVVSTYIFTGLFFIFWKSGWSESFIDFLNLFSPFTIGRTIDSTDLIALIILPISYHFFFGNGIPLLQLEKMKWTFLFVISFVVFTATTYIRPKPLFIDKNYTVDRKMEDIVEEWNRMNAKYQKTVEKDSLYHQNHIHEKGIYIHRYDDLQTTDTIRKYLNYTMYITLMSDTLSISKGKTLVRFNSVESWLVPAGKKKQYKRWFKENYIDILEK